MACLPIADWYVFLGDWLWSGNGMIEAHTPKIMEGWISLWVYVWLYAPCGFSLSSFKLLIVIAIIVVSSSSVSTYLQKIISIRDFANFYGHTGIQYWASPGEQIRKIKTDPKELARKNYESFQNRYRIEGGPFQYVAIFEQSFKLSWQRLPSTCWY